MKTTLRDVTPVLIALAAGALLAGCGFPNKAAPGPSSIAVDSTANQVWIIDSGKIYRCSPSGDSLACKEAATNIPR
jgi:hypothetical protein